MVVETEEQNPDFILCFFIELNFTPMPLLLPTTLHLLVRYKSIILFTLISSITFSKFYKKYYLQCPSTEGPSSSTPAVVEQSFPSFSHNSNEESAVPGRRTPLGTVGLGGFYFQGVCGPNMGHAPPSDENSPEPGGSNR